jgi:translation elongation factor P/translation initiation factor 5A|tara:strand:+ start:1666 stop:2046 length:381 start_codon:yes stop_codon:yes gene_type:complete
MASASELKRGSYFIQNNEPMQVIRKEIVVYGTHSHSKLKLFIKDLTGKGERSINMHHTDKVELIDIVKKTGQVISKTDDKVQIMDNVSYETVDANALEELRNELNEGDRITFVDFKGNVQIIEKRG